MSDQFERMLRKKIKQMSDFSRSPEMQNLKKDVMDIANDVKREFTSAQTGRDRYANPESQQKYGAQKKQPVSRLSFLSDFFLSVYSSSSSLSAGSSSSA